MIPLKRLYTQTPARGLAEDGRFPKVGPSHQDELMQRVFNAEEQAKLSAHLQLNHDRRMGMPVPSLSDVARANALGPLAGISHVNTQEPFWSRKHGFKGAPQGSGVKVGAPTR